MYIVFPRYLINYICRISNEILQSGKNRSGDDDGSESGSDTKHVIIYGSINVLSVS